MPQVNIIEEETNLPNGFVAAKRVSSTDFDDPEQINSFINQICVREGQPLVISGMNRSPFWKQELFTLEHLKALCGYTEVVTSRVDTSQKGLLGSFISSIQAKYKLDQPETSKGSLQEYSSQFHQAFHADSTDGVVTSLDEIMQESQPQVNNGNLTNVNEQNDGVITNVNEKNNDQICCANSVQTPQDNNNEVCSANSVQIPQANTNNQVCSANNQYHIQDITNQIHANTPTDVSDESKSGSGARKQSSIRRSNLKAVQKTSKAIDKASKAKQPSHKTVNKLKLFMSDVKAEKGSPVSELEAFSEVPPTASSEVSSTTQVCIDPQMTESQMITRSRKQAMIHGVRNKTIDKKSNSKQPPHKNVKKLKLYVSESKAVKDSPIPKFEALPEISSLATSATSKVPSTSHVSIDPQMTEAQLITRSRMQTMIHGVHNKTIDKKSNSKQPPHKNVKKLKLYVSGRKAVKDPPTPKLEALPEVPFTAHVSIDPEMTEAKLIARSRKKAMIHDVRNKKIDKKSNSKKLPRKNAKKLKSYMFKAQGDLSSSQLSSSTCGSQASAVAAGSQEKTGTYEPLPYSIDGVYAKDILCPPQYKDALRQVVPEDILPLGVNDLFSILDDRFQAENFMVYLGQDDTGTPIHRDLCGTMGHNVMTTASPNGYAEWYIVVNKDREKFADVIKPPKNQQKLSSSTHSASDSQLKSSFLETDRAWLEEDPSKYHDDMKIQVILQRPGDLVIIPSRAYHQVRNVGVSIKIAWNRITPQTLHYAFEDQLPLYRIINRPEVYKCKAIAMFTLDVWSKKLASNELPAGYTEDSFIEAAKLVLNICANEIIKPELIAEDITEDMDKSTFEITTDHPDDHLTVKCDFCHGDIFSKYVQCQQCNEYDLCLHCYSIGRSCKHPAQMEFRQGPIPLQHYIQLYTTFIKNLNDFYKTEILVDDSHEFVAVSGSLINTCAQIQKARLNGQPVHLVNPISSNKTIKEFDIQYFAHPSNEERNRGCSIDQEVEKV